MKNGGSISGRGLTIWETILTHEMKQGFWWLIFVISFQGWPTLLTFQVMLPKFFSLMFQINQIGRWFYKKKPAPNARWWIQQMYS
jgi:hypothetical protein